MMRLAAMRGPWNMDQTARMIMKTEPFPVFFDGKGDAGQVFGCLGIDTAVFLKKMSL